MKVTFLAVVVTISYPILDLILMAPSILVLISLLKAKILNTYRRPKSIQILALVKMKTYCVDVDEMYIMSSRPWLSLALR